jgi:translation initiation factor IF-2
MAQTNVAQFAKELGVPAAMLLEQLQAAGVGKALVEDTPLSEQDKTQLLEYLQRVHGTKESKNKITLTRKQTSEIKKADATGRSRTIQVEVRKKRVFVKREATAASGEVEAVPAAPTFDVDQTALREEEARKQAELISRQAAEAAAKTERDRKRKPVEEREVREAPPPVVAPTESKAPQVEAQAEMTEAKVADVKAACAWHAA